MTRREQLTLELQRLGKLSVSIHQRYGAYMSLHTAACLNNDAKELEQRRDQLHTVLDALLDNGEAIQRIQTELETLP